ncbi:MAG: hypothetical protein KF900_08855 [Bacteroidetes bacterium]|nr:hypothetical protein [Bacteroidota bacterium]
MGTLIIKSGTEKDIDLLIDIANKIGIKLLRTADTVSEAVGKKTRKDKAIFELSKKVNKSLHKKFIKPVLDDNNYR